jgi:hypothetical protein
MCTKLDYPKPEWLFTLGAYVVKCYMSIALYDGEALALGKLDQKYLENLKCGVGGGW